MRGSSNWHGVDRARRVLLACAAGFAVTVADAPHAGAAGNGMKYVTSDLRKLPSRETASATAKCPKRTFVVGGGLSIVGSNTATGMHSSYPVQLGPHRGGWRVVANSRSASDKKLGAEAVCAKSGRYRYVSGPQVPVPNGGTDFADAYCDEGEPLIGGGVKVSGTSTVLGPGENRPFDSPVDPDDVPQDGWTAGLKNSSGAPGTLRVFAICERTAGAHAYRSEFDSVNSGGQGSVAAGCPAGMKVTAGGAGVSTPTGAVELADSHSYDNGGGNRAPDDGWYQVINNESGGSSTLYTYAICRG